VSAAKDRLSTAYYNNLPVSVGNPGGFLNDGHEANFFGALADVATVADEVAGSADQASGFAAAAMGHRDAAAANAATALNAPGTTATSTTSVAMPTVAGTKTLTIQTGKTIVAGMKMLAAVTASPDIFFSGTVLAYNSGTGQLDINATIWAGTGTYNAWTVSLTGPTATVSPADIGAATVQDVMRQALQLAELKGSTFGTPNGIADDYSTSAGVDLPGSTGENYVSGTKLFTNAIDGTPSWTTATPAGTDLVWSIAYGAGLYVTIGSNGTITTSPDGVTWTSRTSGTAQGLYGISFGNGIFVVTGNAGVILTSPDGITWTSRTSGTTDNLYGAAYGAGIWLVGSTLGTTFTSSNNGVSWSAGATGLGTILNILFVNSLFFVMGGSGMLRSSPDGSTWTARTTGFGASSVQGVTYQYGFYVVVGDAGKISTTPDLTTFTARTTGTSNALNEVTFLSGKMVVVGSSGTILTSSDGITWTSTTSGTTNQLNGAVGAAGLFVAVGGTGGTPIIRTAQYVLGAMDLRSVAFSALTTPLKASLIVYAKGASAITINTHLIAYVSRDNGATWLAVTLAAQETLSNGFTGYAVYGTSITSLPTGTNLKYRFVTTGAFAVDITAAQLSWS
jgi:hypothetical protein